MARLVYALDLGRGFLLVDYCVPVKNVRVRGGLVEVEAADGSWFLFDTGERVLVEEDTPQRRALLAEAHALVAGERL